MTGAPAVVIPAYNPAPCLPEMVRQLAAAADISTVLVVDDGSHPECHPIFQATAQAGARLLRHPVNRGKGAALKTAFRELGPNGVVTADADGQHTVPDILKVTRALQDHPGSLVLGVRCFDASVPWRSRIGNQATRFLMRRLLGATLTDTQTGLRGVPADFVRELLKSPFNRYEFELEMLLRWHASGRPVLEVPIETVYLDQNRLSHFRPLIDSLRVYRVLLRSKR